VASWGGLTWAGGLLCSWVSGLDSSQLSATSMSICRGDPAPVPGIAIALLRGWLYKLQLSRTKIERHEVDDLGSVGRSLASGGAGGWDGARHSTSCESLDSLTLSRPSVPCARAMARPALRCHVMGPRQGAGARTETRPRRARGSPRQAQPRARAGTIRGERQAVSHATRHGHGDAPPQARALDT
jgi:hypothetical protein